MELNEYQKEAMKFAKFSSLDYPFAGLAEEAGEVIGKLAKAQRKWGACQEFVLQDISHGDRSEMFDEESELWDSLKKELGDCLWMLAACASNLNMSLESIGVDNIAKLTDRDARGVICGSGDER